jgi:hypothetical protein
MKSLPAARQRIRDRRRDAQRRSSRFTTTARDEGHHPVGPARADVALIEERRSTQNDPLHGKQPGTASGSELPGASRR